MRTKIRSYLSKVSSAYAHTKEGKVEVSAIATLPTDHSTHSTPRGVSMTAAREPQKKSTKPGRLVTSISKQTLILFDEHLAVGRPMMVSSTKKQYLSTRSLTRSAVRSSPSGRARPPVVVSPTRSPATSCGRS